MFMEERLNEILYILKTEGKILVKDLSSKFNVSEGMIRKDLQRLEMEGKIKRTYGGAILERKIVHNENISSRMIKDLDHKKKIAEKAFSIIEDGDLVFLDISSTNYVIGEAIAASNRKVNIITNMNIIPSLFVENSSVNVICIGGAYSKRLGGVIGAAAIESISKYKADKAFIGTGGLNLEDDFISNFNLEEANTKRAVIKASKRVYLAMENEKFYIDGSYKFASLQDIHGIITEKQPDNKIIDVLRNNKIEII
ncbi:MAG: transcriptional regulator, DeoR family [Clostridiaceae bacterium]|nr:transcriptional regulator, DeoR family [Clostridiaceae bacterium]